MFPEDPEWNYWLSMVTTRLTPKTNLERDQGILNGV